MTAPVFCSPDTVDMTTEATFSSDSLGGFVPPEFVADEEKRNALLDEIAPLLGKLGCEDEAIPHILPTEVDRYDLMIAKQSENMTLLPPAARIGALLTTRSVLGNAA